MTDSLFRDQLAAASAYENLHVPALFSEWAGYVLDAVDLQPGERILDVACGTGVVAREAAARVGADGKVAGLDANPGMLAVARKINPGVEWRQGLAESLPYDDESFDVVVSQFGLMFFTDRARALREMMRVLAPGGRLAVAVWDTLEHTPAYATATDLLRRRAGDHAAEALAAPFVLGDVPTLEGVFHDAGISELEVSTLTGTARFPGIHTMMEADLRGWLPMMGVMLGEAQIEQILAEAEQALSEYVTDGSALVFDSPAHIALATKR